MKLRSIFAAAVILLATRLATTLHAELFWDTNGTNPGATDDNTNGTAPGTWGTDSYWTTDGALGLLGTNPWTPDETAVFAADINAFGPYTVGLNGTQSAAGVRFEDGAVTLSGGQLTLSGATPTVTVDVGFPLNATINSVIGGSAAAGTPGLIKAGTGTLVLGGANTYTGNTRIAANGGTIQFGANEVIPNTSVLEIGGAGAVFELNGKTETVKSITNVGSGFAGSRIDVGNGTLIIDDTDTTPVTTAYQLSYTGSSTGKIIKNGNGQLNLSGISNAWDGEFVLNSGTVGVGEIRVFGDSSSSSAKLTINGGELRLTGNTLSVRVPKVDIAGDFSYSNATSGNQLQFIGSAGSVVFTLQTANPVITSNSTGATGTLIFAGKIVDGPGNDPGDIRGFTKDGPGTITLHARDNSYRGPTTIKAGTLTLGTNASIAGLVGTPGNLGSGDGALILQGGRLNATTSRSLLAADNQFIKNPLDVQADAAITGTNNSAGNSPANLVLSSNTVGGSGGTLTLRNDAAAGGANPINHILDVRFTGSGFNFPRPLDLPNGVNADRKVRLVSANIGGTQTWSGVISGAGGVRRTIGPEDTAGTGGTTVLTAANTYSGGTLVEDGTVSVSGATAALGTGNVTITGGHLEIAAGVANAIADTATLSLAGGGTTGVADVAYADLGTGINEVIASLILAGNTLGAGTYGSGSSTATNPGLVGLGLNPNDFFAGTGIITVSPAVVPLLGDFNSDGKVDAADYVVWRDNENSFTPLPNDNGLGTPIGGAHYNLWKSNFGNSTPGASASVGNVAVPEPASILLVLILAGATMGGYRRR